MKTLIEALNHIIEGQPLVVTGNVSVTPVQYNRDEKIMEACMDDEADKYGVYVEVKGRHNNTDYFESYWIQDFCNKKQANTYAETVKAVLPAYYFISDRVGSVKDYFEDNRLDAARIIKGHLPDAPLAADEFSFNGEIYTCLNGACF